MALKGRAADLSKLPVYKMNNALTVGSTEEIVNKLAILCF